MTANTSIVDTSAPAPETPPEKRTAPPWLRTASGWLVAILAAVVIYREPLRRRILARA